MGPKFLKRPLPAFLTALTLVVGIPFVLLASAQWRLEAGNKEAALIFDKLCRPENLYLSGTFDDWMTGYRQIKRGDFDDRVHLRQWEENRLGESEWPIQLNDQVFTNASTITFMESDHEIVLRDFVLYEKHLTLGLMDDGISRRRGCIRDYEPELERFLNDR